MWERTLPSDPGKSSTTLSDSISLYVPETMGAFGILVGMDAVLTLGTAWPILFGCDAGRRCIAIQPFGRRRSDAIRVSVRTTGWPAATVFRLRHTRLIQSATSVALV